MKCGWFFSISCAFLLGACPGSSPAPDEAADAGSTTVDGSMGSGGSTTMTPVPTEAPPTPTLRSPTDEERDVAIDTPLCWEAVDYPAPVRYRVFVDGIELSAGKTGENGFRGTCTESLLFEHDRAYSWAVLAEHADDQSLASDMSEAWSFHTMWDGNDKVLFEDDFSSAKEWTFGGDAKSGHWERGNPVPTEIEGTPAQPGECFGGEDCMFTAQNADADPDEHDVDGGETSMTSPEFDPTDAKSITVSLARHFYRSDYEQTGSSLRVELLVPDEAQPGGYVAHVLEKLDNDDAAQAAGVWTPVAFSTCGIDLAPGTKLKIAATDLGEGIVEAAIDNVVVTGHNITDNCNKDVGALCQPNVEGTCSDGLLCCPHGVINEGIYRCAEPVAAIDPENPPASPEDANNGAMGCDAPDLRVESEGLDGSFDTIEVSPDSCVLIEGCVDAPGLRRILRFDTITSNIGSRDLELGIPQNHLDLFHYSVCHDHHHFDAYARYSLLDQRGNVVAKGHKQAFCLLDWSSWAWPELDGHGDGNGDDARFSCYNQGISRGWLDEYSRFLDCQWIDVTEVPPGQYVLRIEVNLPDDNMALPTLVERDYTNNVLELPVEVPAE